MRETEFTMTNVRVQTWERFKGLAIEHNPKSIVYIIAQSIPAKDLTSLKILLLVKGMQYIFTDSAKDNKLRKTGIPIHTDNKRNRYIEDVDVKSFLLKQLNRNDLQIFSYWTI